MTTEPRTHTTHGSGPLADVRVLDFTQFLSGPYGTQLLGDLGAEIIKVEAPAGDLSRTVAPHFIAGDSAYFHTINRNKKSIVIDLKSDGAKKLVQSLIDECDVVVENFRPGVLARLGIDRETEMKRRPSLIWASITGFGQTGPLKDHTAYDMIVQALSGVMSLTGEPGGKPVRTGPPIGDLAGGLYAVIGILAALNRRHIDGVGDYVDISMLDGLTAMLSYQGTYFLHSGAIPGLQGGGHDSVPTYRLFRAADGVDVATTANTERMWQSMATLLGVPELIDDPRFRTNTDRLANKEALWSILEPAFLQRPAREWVELFNQESIPVAVVNNVGEALSSEQTAAREMVVEMRNDAGDVVRTLGNPVKMSSLSGATHSFPPKLGADTASVLRDVLSLPDDEIEELVSSGVVHAASEPRRRVESVAT